MILPVLRHLCEFERQQGLARMPLLEAADVEALNTTIWHTYQETVGAKTSAR